MWCGQGNVDTVSMDVQMHVRVQIVVQIFWVYICLYAFMSDSLFSLFIYVVM